ncbi:hypothetical protein PG987_013628 [Apiospora arundinis]
MLRYQATTRDFGTSPTFESALDPFDSFVTPLKAEEHFLLNHYMTTVMYLESTHSRLFPDPREYRHSVRTHWVPTAFSDLGMLSGLLLFACRHLYFCTEKATYKEQALQYKGACLSSLKESLSRDGQAGKATDTTIAKALQMASDELADGEIGVSRFHMHAVKEMVISKRGIGTLGMDGFLAKCVSMFTRKEDKGSTIDGPLQAT